MNTVKFRHLVSKVIVKKDSPASTVQDILGWLKESIEKGTTKIVVKD